MQMIDSTRITLGEVRWDRLVRVVVAIDPAVTSGEHSNETGIVVAALTMSGHVLVLDDLTLRGTPREWGTVAVNAYLSRRADRIVGEVNNGGDLVEGNIRAINANVPYRAVRASRGKLRRAEPVAALYEQGRVHHVGTYPEMEEQMCGYVPGAEMAGDSKSPDRMDALVWAVTELLIDPEVAREKLVYNPLGEYRISQL
jgi:phage terminase large subunit-like protein